jgi:hypothetical protein
VVFSDSIVLTIAQDTPEALVTIAGACSRLLFDLLQQGFPIRGAVSRGQFVRESIGESVFVAGRSVIDAYAFEQRQDWVGIMLAQSAVAAVPDLFDRCLLHGNLDVPALMDRFEWAAYIQRCPSIPVHTETPFEHSTLDGYAIVPTTGVPTEPAKLRDSTQAAVKQLDWLRISSAPTPAAQEKYRKASQWLSGRARISES